MNRRSSLPELRRGNGLTVRSILSRLLLALLFIVTLASCTPRRALTQQGVLDLAGVSVVRLVVYYVVSPIAGYDPVYHVEEQCTGLGMLVCCWTPARTTEKNNWVLTDGTLVNTKGGTCLPETNSQLAGIQILANNAYTNNSPGQALIGSLQCHRPGQETICSDTEPETISSSAGAVLFSFHTAANHLQPFLLVAAPGGRGTPPGVSLG